MVIADKNSPMSITDAARTALLLVLKHEERRVGSKEVALANVARTVGTSASWLRKFLGNHAEVSEPRITLFVNIRRAYEGLCARIEQEQQNELARVKALQGQLHAVTEGFVGMVESAPRTTAP